ncbi:MAG: hypothetical protein J5I50_12180 [Chitinophagaceae bacterium]|nr:hypothetical protein [Chitinophagaceae bacterium]
MKKISLILMVLLFGSFSFASMVTPVTTAPRASDIYLPLGNNTQVSLKDFSVMTVKEYEEVTGKHLNLFKKIELKIIQKKIRKSIAKDGTFKNDKLLSAMSLDDPSQGFHLGGFALGFLIGPIGVLIAYLIGNNSAVDTNRRKWAWIGLAGAVVLWLLFL